MGEVTSIQNTSSFLIIGHRVIQFASVPRRAAGDMQNRLTNNRLNPPWLLSRSYSNFPQLWPAALRAAPNLSPRRLTKRGEGETPPAKKIYNWRRKHKTLRTHLINPPVCRVYKLRVQQSQGKALARPSHRAPSQANQYHFPVLELGNYEVERLPDLSPALHYFADIKINCLILGKHMLQFKLSALVCSGIICIDLPASSQFCLLTSWIIREGALGKLKSGMKKKYEEE